MRTLNETIISIQVILNFANLNIAKIMLEILVTHPKGTVSGIFLEINLSF